MPKLPMDYSKTIIYKIEHIDDDSLVYVGHTTNWDKRKCRHKYNCYAEKNGHYNLKLYKMIRENGGWENFKMIEIEKYPCNDKREAEKRECEVMKELKASMNMMKSYVSEEEYRERNKERGVEYYKSNKDKVKERCKKYYENNKDKIKEYKKEYKIENIEKIREYQKRYYQEYYEKNKQKEKERLTQYRRLNPKKSKDYYNNNKSKILENMKEKIDCDCGCEVNKTNLKRHQTTKKHIDLIKNKI